MLVDENVHAAQSRVAALLAAAAHTSVRALGRHDGCKTLSRESARELAGAAMRVEQLAAGVFQQYPATGSRAEDVAVLSVQPGHLSLEEAIEVWGREARDTIRSSTPSARDLQFLAADLSRIATHTRAIVRAAVALNSVDPAAGRPTDASLASAAASWLDVAHAWTGLHTAQPPTPSKIAASHALGQALTAATRDGQRWADPEVVADRVDLVRALAALRRADDVARDVAHTHPELTTRLADSGLLFKAAAAMAPSLDRLQARIHDRLVVVSPADIGTLAEPLPLRREPIGGGVPGEVPGPRVPARQSAFEV